MTNNFMRTALLALAILALPVSVMAQPVILVFDLDRAVAASKAGKSMAKQLDSQVNKIRKEEESKIKKLQSEVDKLKEQQKLMAPEALQAKYSELQQQEIERRQSLSERTQAVQAGGQKAAAEIVKVAEKELSDIAKERKADIVMRRDAVFFASPAINVTQELVKRLDKQLSSVKVTPIAQTKAKR